MDVTAVSSDERLESTFIEDQSNLVLDVRTKDESLEYQLVKYFIKAGDGSLARTGFLVLHRDESDWIGDHVEVRRRGTVQPGPGTLPDG